MLAAILGISVMSCSLLLVYIMIRVGLMRSETSESFEPPTKEEMKQHILWRAFYVNPQDPRGWVPKTWGFGYTVNFREKAYAAIFAALIVVTLILAIALVVVTLTCPGCCGE